MNDFRGIPKGDYIFDTRWEDLYALTKHWKSDLLFYKDDLNFLNHIINKYFIWISKKEDNEAMQIIIKNVTKTKKTCSVLLKQIDIHLKHLSSIMENHFKYDSQKLRIEHQKLEDDVTNFIKTFRTNRKQVFKLTEHVIESEEFVRLLAND